MFVLLLAMLALGGGAVFCVGMRGRVIDDHPLCAKCRFDLSGLTSPPTCPECGADLALRHAVRIGHRRRRRPLLAAGLLLLLVCVAGFAALGWGAATRFNCNTLSPAWVLLRRARSHEVDPGVLKELSSRYRAQRLDTDNSREIVLRALEVQRDDTITWDRSWADIIEAARSHGELNDDQRRQYAEHAFGSLTFKPTENPQYLERRQGQLYITPLLAVGRGRGGLSITLRKHHRLERLVWNGKEIAIPDD